MQVNIFGEIETQAITVENAAKTAGVSEATIRNWIKTGYLDSPIKGYITSLSLSKFITQIIGKEKLNARANKLKKNNHNHIELSEFIEKQLITEKMNENLWQDYENSLSESFRNKEGIYYTPENIVIDMMKSIENVSDKIFLDPCCGGGNFIIQALKMGFKPENVFGFDTDKNAVEIAKKRIFEHCGCKNENIICEDFLKTAQKLNNKYDYIFTNPPWGKKLQKNIKDGFSVIYNTGKSNDTSSLFFFACLSLLAKGGKLGFLLPEAFFNISTFEDARKRALELNVERLIDYGKPFKGLLTRAQAIILKNETATDGSCHCGFDPQSPDKVHIRNQVSFSKLPKKIFNFWAKQDAEQVIEHVYSLPHITLENNARWALGIVTGNNEKICQKLKKEGVTPIFRGQDITANGLKEPTLFIDEIDLKKCQQVAPIEFYKAKEKLIYRFIFNKLVFYCDKEQNFILNSANLLILNEKIQISGQQLVDLLNSDFMNFIFQNIFHTHKILRGDLECLPIHAEYFAENKNFDENKYLDYLKIKKENGT
ncbi:MAG: N-6 DNA methylase, partial [Bacteroidales bacterium]|nr:N-6 DNA methylase [Bacteroidales bacterium]